jgi:predicted RNA binding protein with dsRBD fold (UPF0201 family)
MGATLPKASSVKIALNKQAAFAVSVSKNKIKIKML